MDTDDRLVPLILDALPGMQAVYLFGSWGTGHERAGSDVDVAVLLPPEEAKKRGSLVLGDLHLVLESELARNVDLINLREVSTVFQKEIVMTGRRIFCADVQAVDEFEMLVLSLYQKLNAERAGIIAEGLESGRFYDV